jgi:hypothetical protein
MAPGLGDTQFRRKNENRVPDPGLHLAAGMPTRRTLAAPDLTLNARIDRRPDERDDARRWLEQCSDGLAFGSEFV